MRRTTGTVALLLALAGPLVAQDGGRIRGSAVDETGQPLPGVTVGLHTEGAASRSLTTDAEGRFDAVDIPAGAYQVDFRLPGFATTVRKVMLAAGGSEDVKAVLRLALSADVLVTSPAHSET